MNQRVKLFRNYFTIIAVLFGLMVPNAFPADPVCPKDGSWPLFIATAGATDDIAILQALMAACGACTFSATSSSNSAQGGDYCKLRIFMQCGGINASVNADGHVEVGINVGTVQKAPFGSIEVLKLYDTTGSVVTDGGSASCMDCHLPWSYGRPAPPAPVPRPYNAAPYSGTIPHVPDPIDTFEGIPVTGGNDKDGNLPNSQSGSVVGSLEAIKHRYCECCRPDETDTTLDPINDPPKETDNAYCSKMKEILNMGGQTSPLCGVLTVTKTGTAAARGTVTSTPSGIICGTDCKERYDFNKLIDLNAVAAAGTIFAGWSGGGCSGTGTCQVTMNAAKTVTATFNTSPLTKILTVTKTGGGAGTVTSLPSGISCGATCSKAYPVNTNVQLSQIPTASSIFTGWSGGGCSGTGGCTVLMNVAKTVTASFKLVRNLTLATGGTGTISRSSGGIGSCGTNCFKYINGDSVTLTATPGAGFVFTSWSGACTGSGGCTLSMVANKSVTATFTTTRPSTTTIPITSTTTTR